MKVWYTEHCRLAMQMHQVQDLLFSLSHDAIESRADAEARAWADSRRLGPYLDLAFRQEQLHALGREIQLPGQSVFVWLDLVHTNSRAYARLTRQPLEAGIDLLEPILSQEAQTLSLWASSRMLPLLQVALPDLLQPWRELVMLDESRPDPTLELPARFAQWIQLRLKEGVEGSLLFLTRSPERLAKIKDALGRKLLALGLIGKNSLTTDLEALPFVRMATLQDFQLELLSRHAGGAAPELLRRFRLDRHWSFHRFRRRYWQQVRARMAPELAWEVLRTLLKDTPGGDAPTLERYRREIFPARESRSPTPEEYRLVYEDIWSKWYRHTTERTGWDDQDLARTVLAEVAEFPGYAGICIDADPPLTRLELQVVRKLCLLERYRGSEQLPPGSPLPGIAPNSGHILVSRQLPHSNCYIQVPPAAPARPFWAQLGGKPEHLPFTPDTLEGKSDGPCDLFAIGRTLLQSCFEGRPAWLELLSNTPVIHVLNVEDPAASTTDPFLGALLPPPEHGAIRNLFTVTTAGLLELDVAILYGAGRAFRELLRATVSPQDARIESLRIQLVQAIGRVKKALLIVDSEADLAYFWLSQWSPLPKDAIKSLHVEPFWQMELARAWPGVQDSLGNLPLNRFRVEDVALLALRLQQAGLEHKEPQLLRQAAACFTRSGSPKEADIAAALALRHDDNRATAGEVFLRLNLLSEAELDFWEGLQWDSLNTLYSTSLTPKESIRPMIATFLCSSTSENVRADDERCARLKQILPSLEAFLQSRPCLSPSSPHWQLLAERLREDYELCAEALSVVERTSLARSVEGLFQAGLVMLAELAGTCWFELGQFERAVQCWEQEGIFATTAYAIAKGFTTSPPARYRWWLEAREYQRIVEDWRTTPSSDAAVITQVQEAIRQLERFRGREPRREPFAPQVPITGTRIARLLASVESSALGHAEGQGRVELQGLPGPLTATPDAPFDPDVPELLCDPLAPEDADHAVLEPLVPLKSTAPQTLSPPVTAAAVRQTRGSAKLEPTLPATSVMGREPQVGAVSPAVAAPKAQAIPAPKKPLLGNASVLSSPPSVWLEPVYSQDDIPGPAILFEPPPVRTEKLVALPPISASGRKDSSSTHTTEQPGASDVSGRNPASAQGSAGLKQVAAGAVLPGANVGGVPGVLPSPVPAPVPAPVAGPVASGVASGVAPPARATRSVGNELPEGGALSLSPSVGVASSAVGGAPAAIVPALVVPALVVPSPLVPSPTVPPLMVQSPGISSPVIPAPAVPSPAIPAPVMSAPITASHILPAPGALVLPQVCTLERIEELRLRNFRAFEDARLGFEDLTLLVGRNGVGLSVLADALAFFHDCAAHSLLAALERRGGLARVMSWEALNRPAGMTLALVLRLHVSGKAYRVVYGMTLEQDAEDTPSIREERLEVEGANDLGFYRDGLAFYTGMPGLDPRPDARTLALPLVASAHPIWQGVLRALSRIRVCSPSISAMREGCVRGMAEGLEPDGSSAPEVLAQLELHGDKLKELKARLAAILPDVEDCRTQTSGRRRLLQVSLKTREGSARFFDADLLPGGVLRVLGWLLALMQQPSPSIVFLDGLDEGLHPITLGGLLEDILSRSMQPQVIVGVHGAEALLHSRMSASKVRWVAREDGRSRIYAVQPDALDDDPAELLERFRSDSLPRMRAASVVQGRWFELEKRSYSTGSNPLWGLG